jgi:hypothetical protein
MMPALLFRQADARTPMQAALAFVGSGQPVFPCVPGEKSPLTTHGFQDASVDKEQIVHWWRRSPDANLGIPTGSDGFDVVDVDNHASGSGFEGLDRARQSGFIDGWEFIVRTPSGGLHLYYRADPQRPQRSWSLGASHIDFRGTGGYVVAPPSKVMKLGETSGYHLIAVGRQPHPLDSARLRRFLDPPSPIDPAPTFSTALAKGSSGRIGSWLANRREGSRNNALFWASCRFAEDRIPEEIAIAELAPAAIHSGLAEREVAATIRSAYRNVAQSARPMRVLGKELGR